MIDWMYAVLSGSMAFASAFAMGYVFYNKE